MGATAEIAAGRRAGSGVTDRARRVLAAVAQLLVIAVVFLVGARWVNGSLNDGGRVHLDIGLAGGRAQLLKLTHGVSLSDVRSSLLRDDVYALLYGGALLIGSIGKDGLRIRRLQRLYVNVRILAVMTVVADLVENSLLLRTLRRGIDPDDGMSALTYTSDLAAELVRAASILKWTCVAGALVATVIRLGSTIMPQSKPSASLSARVMPPEAVGAEMAEADGREAGALEPKSDRRNDRARAQRQAPETTAETRPETRPLDEALERWSESITDRMARKWRGRD